MTGLCHEGRTAERPDGPALLPAAACDYTTGYLAAYGILLALAKRARDGGSYHVRVSLCQSGMFIYRQGKVAFPGLGLDLSAAELDAIRIESRPKSGPLRHLGPILKFSEAPAALDPADAATGRRCTGMAGGERAGRRRPVGRGSLRHPRGQ